MLTAICMPNYISWKKCNDCKSNASKLNNMQIFLVTLLANSLKKL
jgi:hypothetical protein